MRNLAVGQTGERTSMNCVRCGGFSSTRTCWSCSQRLDAIEFSLLETYRKDAERYRWLQQHLTEIVWHGTRMALALEELQRSSMTP